MSQASFERVSEDTTPPFFLNAGHGEYMPSGACTWTTVYEPEWNEETDEVGHRSALVYFLTQHGVERDRAEVIAASVDAAWQFVEKVEGTLSQHEADLLRFLDELAITPTGDDTVYDYWPSGVRLAREWAEAINAAGGRDLTDAVEKAAREALDGTAHTMEEVGLA